MTPIFFTLGLLLKTLHLSKNSFKPWDILVIPFALVSALLVVIMVQDGNFLNQSEFIVLPIVYVTIIAFLGFKDRLLPVVTEGSLLVNGLIGLYLYVMSSIETGDLFSTGSVYLLLVFTLYISVALAVVLFSQRVTPLFQAFCMAMFIGMSVYISLALLVPLRANLDNPFWAVVIGFSSLSLIANILYLSCLIPYKHEEQTWAERMRSIGKHLEDFEKKYIDANISRQNMLLILILIVSVVSLEIFSNLETPVISAIALILAGLISENQTLSADTPMEFIKAE